MEVPNVKAPGGKKKKLPKIVIVVPIAIALIAVFFLVGPGKSMISGGKKDPKAGDIKKNEENKLPEAAFELGDFVINLKVADPNVPRYVKVGIAIGVENEAGMEFLKERSPIFKDLVIERFSSATIQELNDSSGRDKVKHDLETEFASLLPKDIKIHGIYITQLAFQ